MSSGSREFDRLLGAVADGSLDDAGRARFNALVREDASLIDAYLDHLAAHAMLRREFGSERAVMLESNAERGSRNAEVSEPTDGGRATSGIFNFQFSIFNLQSLALIAAALLVACGLAIYFFTLNPEPSHPEPSLAPVATLIDASEGATVIVNDDVANPGQDYRAGSYSIASGSAELMLTNNVAVTLRGDTQLFVHHNMRASLRHGSAVFTCPPGTRGYTVELPDRSRIIDLGTSFAVEIDDSGEADVRVLRGEVAWTSTGPLAESVRVVAGQMARAEGDAVVVASMPLRTAYAVPAGTVGNQAFAGSLGMDFVVDEPITLTHLGAFDSGGDGLKRPISVRLYDEEQQLIASTTIRGDAGELIGGTRYVALSEPVRLPEGFAGTIVASGYGPEELAGNAGESEAAWLSHAGSNGSAVRYVGLGRWGDASDAYPGVVDSGPTDRYAAGSFRYQPGWRVPASDHESETESETITSHP